MSLIALMTDFGSTDPYVGIIKAVMLGIAPDVTLIDLTHAVQPQNIRQAAFLLRASYHYFPVGTVFLVVVDPGVGTARRAIGVEADGYRFVAPDNGVLSGVLVASTSASVVELTAPTYRLARASSTFHGRDIFAPAAAHLAAGVPLKAFGAQVHNPVMLPLPEPTVTPGSIAGSIIHVDHFGNLITTLGEFQWNSPTQLTVAPPAGDAVLLPSDRVTVVAGGHTLRGIRHTYGEAGRGELLALIGSSGYLEISVNHGSAADALKMAIGDRVEIRLS